MRIFLVTLVCLSANTSFAQDDFAGVYAGILGAGSVGTMGVEHGAIRTINGTSLATVVGYRQNFGSWVGGVEVKASVGRSQWDMDYIDTIGTITLHSDAEFRETPAASIAASFGIPVDNFLIYGFAGASAISLSLHSAEYGISMSYNGGIITTIITPYTDDWKGIGFALIAGAGLDARITDNLLLRTEYTFTHLPATTVTSPAAWPYRVVADVHTFSVGLIHQF